MSSSSSLSPVLLLYCGENSRQKEDTKSRDNKGGPKDGVMMGEWQGKDSIYYANLNPVFNLKISAVVKPSSIIVIAAIIVILALIVTLVVALIIPFIPLVVCKALYSLCEQGAA